ncbi:shikimate kinase [Isoptericola sp. G70]|uniref:shikimate kinase n=1 Tax=Isoptericola sp. G70 TaxID=3376633 RepID=UPI003A7FAAA7
MIALVGMPGAGKTTVGRELGRRTSLGFADSDALVDERFGDVLGRRPGAAEWRAFRACERTVLTELAARPGGIVAIGGGGWHEPETRADFAGWRTVYLRVPLDTLVVRHRGRHRVMFAEGDLRERLRSLLDEREAEYATAEVVVDAQHPVDEVVARITDAVRRVAHEV